MPAGDGVVSKSFKHKVNHEEDKNFFCERKNFCCKLQYPHEGGVAGNSCGLRKKKVSLGDRVDFDPNSHVYGK